MIFRKGKFMRNEVKTPMVFSILCVFILLVLAACSIEFDRNYDQIDDDMVRPISYQFTNPETAPGDTTELEILFVGKPLNSIDDIKWRVSWNIYTDGYGNLAPRGESDLKLIGAPTLRDEKNGQIVSIKFQIPDSILHKADVIPNDLSTLMNNYQIGNIAEMLGFSKKADVLDSLKRWANMSNAEKEQIPFQFGAMINGLAQIFSSQYEIYLDINVEGANTPRTKIRNTARWHGKLNGIKGIFINNNPKVRFSEWRVWAMNEKNAYNFDKSKATPVYRNGDTINIPVNRNQTIFMEVFASPKDSALTLEQAFTTQIVNIENYSGIWFFEGKEFRRTLDISGEPPFGASPDGYGVVRISVGDNAKAGDTGWIWTAIYDERHGVANHPQGRCTIGFPVKFVD